MNARAHDLRVLAGQRGLGCGEGGGCGGAALQKIAQAAGLGARRERVGSAHDRVGLARGVRADQAMNLGQIQGSGGLFERESVGAHADA